MAEMPGVVKRFSEKQASKKVRFHGSDHNMHRRDGADGKGDKDGKVKYADLGHKSQFGDKDTKHYPSLHVEGDKLKELHGHHPGDHVEMSVKGKLKEHRIDDDGKHHFQVDVTHAAVKK